MGPFLVCAAVLIFIFRLESLVSWDILTSFKIWCWGFIFWIWCQGFIFLFWCWGFSFIHQYKGFFKMSNFKSFLGLVYPYPIIEDIFNRFNLRLSQKKAYPLDTFLNRLYPNKTLNLSEKIWILSMIFDRKVLLSRLSPFFPMNVQFSYDFCSLLVYIFYREKCLW